MLLSFGLILTLGLLAGHICSRIKLPPLFGMLLAGILLGPCALDLIDGSILEISAEIRRIALIIILIRAGLNLNMEDLRKVGRPAILMCFVPATFEIIGMALLAPRFFSLSLVDSLLLATVIAAVSPAVIVPHMLKVMDEGHGTKKGIPQMILAGASADDVYVIVLFTSLLGLASEGRFEALSLMRIPTSIGFGIAGGILTGYILYRFLERFKVDDTKAIVLFLCIGFFLVSIEDRLNGLVGFSGLIAIMAMGICFRSKNPEQAQAISAGFSKLWVVAEVLLFVLVGAAVDISYAYLAGAAAIILVASVLIFRVAGVALCVMGTKLRNRERLFCALSYTPKATVQAAIGSIPLSMGLASGETILTVAVVAILFTAPLGAFLIDHTYQRLLER